jgi:hypothetical protein
MSIEIESTNPVVRAVIEGTAPRPAQIAAARGMLPLPQNDLLEVLVAFAASDDTEIAGHARTTINESDPESLRDSISSPHVPIAVLNYFAHRQGSSHDIHETIVSNPRTPMATIVDLARTTTSGLLLEQISFNQQLLIKVPALIDAIISNPNKTSEAERRAAETKREFFEKERGAQQIASELRAQGKEAAAEFFEQADLENSTLSAEDAILLAEMLEIPDAETDDSWMGLEYLEEFYEETPEERQAIVNKILGEMKADDVDLPNEKISVINRVMMLGMKDRVKLAMKGDREARNILIRDPNRIVCQAVIANPRITEQEMEKIAAMRSVSEDILRKIANDRQWARSYAIVHNLARNPRTPIANILTILSRLQLRDLMGLSKNKNVSDAVRKQAQRLAEMRKGG